MPKDKKEIKTEIETNGRFLRENIREVLLHYEGRLLSEAKNGLTNFIMTLNENLFKQNRYNKYSKQEIISRILNDIESYGVKFEHE